MADGTSLHTMSLQVELQATFEKLTWVFLGVYIREFASSVSFDWWLFTRKGTQQRPRMAKGVRWLYMACRIFGLVASIELTVPYISVGKLQCSANIKTFNIASVLATASATTLLFVRVGVVWRWDKRVTAVFVLMQTINIALGAYSTAQLRAFDGYSNNSKTTSACQVTGINANLPGVSTTLLTDFGLLCLLLIGLRRWVYGGMFSLWHILWNQGVIYLILTLIVGVPLLVSLALSLSGLISAVFTLPLILLLPIAASRFYRSLTGFAGGQQTYESIVLPSGDEAGGLPQ
ncbi:hypothetical protein PENSPDRAFT_687774 [Peniophora sp. CONT]|nr:hypothetical protein PENSPDRAFT_687774 [Peniophora sp. CONT]